MRLLHLLPIALALLLLTAGAVMAQTGGEELTVYAGAAVYSDPVYDSVGLIEIPFSLTRHEFEFFRPTEVDSFLYARIFAQADLLGPSGLPMDSVSTYFSVRAASDQEAQQEGIRLFNKLVLFARPGVYSVRLTVIDVVSKHSGTVFLDRINVEPAVAGRIALGGPMLAYRATQVEDTTTVNMRLVRNRFYVLPNPVGVFSTKDTIAYCYGEVYNLLAVESDTGDFRLTLELLTTSDSLLRPITSRVARQEGESVAFGEPVDIRNWLPGGYHMRVIAEDLTNGQADSSTIPFAIVSPAVIPAEGSGIAGDPYEELSLKERVSLVWYLLTPEQRATVEKLAVQGKQTFLAQYWAEHDANPSTPLNESRVEMVERLRYANERFSLNETKDDGWLTDRGRIYMTFGPWDEIDDRSMPVGGEPAYQVWYYRSVKEGKVFVFVDPNNNHDYRLVHSNVYGEVYNKDWAEQLERGFPDFSTDM